MTVIRHIVTKDRVGRNMIFVTVGTHEQQFDRLISCIDQLKKEGKITERVLIQTGYSKYVPQYCEWQQFFTYDEMLDNVAKARIVITHGGPSSFIMPLQVGKTPIVVPRRKKFGEHVNNHQVEFCNAVAKRMGTIIVVNRIENLEKCVLNYDKAKQRLNGKKGEGIGNNTEFCKRFESIVDGMIEGKN